MNPTNNPDRVCSSWFDHVRPRPGCTTSPDVRMSIGFLSSSSDDRKPSFDTPTSPHAQVVPRTSVSTSSNADSSDAESPVDDLRAWRSPRAPRPSYSEEQKFFIMYCRIVRDMNWLGIEDAFSDTFRHRSKGGLTSVYYRIRRDWGLEDVLRGGSDTSARDRDVITTKAANFSNDFLFSIGYLR